MSARKHRQFLAMARKVENTKQHDKIKKTSTTKYHITANNTMENVGKIWDDTPNRFMKTDGQKWVVFDGNLIPKRYLILESLSTKIKTQSPWEADEMEQTGKGGVKDAITEILYFWNLGSLNFHFILEDKSR